MAVNKEMTLDEEEAYIRGLRAQHGERIADIQRAFRARQSRKALIARFGQDIVDLAIADLSEP